MTLTGKLLPFLLVSLAAGQQWPWSQACTNPPPKLLPKPKPNGTCEPTSTHYMDPESEEYAE